MKRTVRRLAARRALSIPAIAQGVALAAVRLNEHWRKSPTCASLARTCRVLYEPVMDVLWYELLDFQYLLRCFPDDVWSLEDAGEFLELRRAPYKEADWPRFLANARRVRIVGVDDGHTSPEFFKVLALYRPGGTVILPNLRDLSWYSHALNAADEFTFPMLLGAQITTIDIDLLEGALPYHFLEVVHHICPQLRTLRMSGGENLVLEHRYGWLTLGGLYTTVTSLKSLVKLSVDIILDDAKVIIAIGTELQLQELGLTILVPRGYTDEFAYPAVFCPSLQVLRLATCNGTPTLCIADFLRAISSDQLRAVSLTPAHSDPSVDPTILNDVFTALSSHRSLQRISIYRSTMTESRRMQWSALSPLFTLSELRELHLGDTDVVLTSADLAVVTPIWPKLEQLYMWPSDDFKPTHTLPISVCDLPTILVLWPHLTELAVPFDATVAHPSSDADTHPTPIERPITVRTWLCPISRDRIGGISEFLAKTIPTVELACTPWHAPGKPSLQNDRTVAWELVKQIIPTLRRMREGGGG